MTIDQVVGRNVVRARELRRMTQAELAAKMSARGWRFHQQTVMKLEKGERALRLAEAADMADVFDVGLAALTWQPFHFDRAANLERLINVVHQEMDNIAHATKEVLKLQSFIRHDVEVIERDRLDIGVGDAIAVLEQSPVGASEAAVREYLRELAEENEEFEHGSFIPVRGRATFAGRGEDPPVIAARPMDDRDVEGIATDIDNDSVLVVDLSDLSAGVKKAHAIDLENQLVAGRPATIRQLATDIYLVTGRSIDSETKDAD